MLEIAHVKGKHSTLIILHVYPLCKWLQGGLRLFMPGCDKNKAADDCNEKNSGVMFPLRGRAGGIYADGTGGGNGNEEDWQRIL